MKELEKQFCIRLGVVLIVFIVFNCIFFTCLLPETITIEDSIIDIKKQFGGNGKIKNLVVKFNGGETYKIVYEKDLNLTRNSEVNIEMSRLNCFLWPDEPWIIKGLIKMR